MLPQGMFSVAVATILYPSLARLSTRGDLAGFRATVSSGLRQINFMLIPSAVVCAVLAEPIVRLLYQRGAFEPGQTTVVAGALAAFSLGLTFNGMMLMLNRAFFSLQAPWVPTLDRARRARAEHRALRRSSTASAPGESRSRSRWRTSPASRFSSSRCAAASAVSTCTRWPGPSGSSRSPSAVLGVVAYGVWYVLDSALGRSFAAQLVSLGVALGVGGAVYLAVCSALRVREMAALLSLRDRFRRD